MHLSDDQIACFREVVWDYYNSSGRSMPWRDNPNPYWVLVSETMLQQTQVNRVTPKFTAFIERFASIEQLGSAQLSDVLRVWSGLGYNRRAQFLHASAIRIVETFGGKVPKSLEELVSLPGIGRNTAGAIRAYAYNLPELFIETNVRTVYIHHFLRQEQGVDDVMIRSLLEQTIDIEQPREWYWALMDYGSYIKQTKGNNIDQSRHYTKQSRFNGSKRQVRGNIIRLLLDGPISLKSLKATIVDDRITDVLSDLESEGLIAIEAGTVKLTDQPKLP